MSPAKRARPLMSGGSSSRATDFPIHLLLALVIGVRRCGLTRAGRAPRQPAWAHDVGAARASSFLAAGPAGVAAGKDDHR
jgi:hypothetical protein